MYLAKAEADEAIFRLASRDFSAAALKQFMGDVLRVEDPHLLKVDGDT